MPKVQPASDEDLLSLALKHRVSIDQITAHPDNASLRGSRTSAVLHEKDEWTVPDPVPRQHGFETGQTSTYVYVPPTRMIHLRLLGDGGEPVDADYTLNLEYAGDVPPDQPAQLHGFAHRGLVEEEVSAYVSKATLSVLPWDGEPFDIELQLARLDPVTTHMGLLQRLRLLGFHIGLLSEDEFGPHVMEAVHSFQLQHALCVTGHADPVTRQKLVEVCGA